MARPSASPARSPEAARSRVYLTERRHVTAASGVLDRLPGSQHFSTLRSTAPSKVLEYSVEMRLKPAHGGPFARPGLAVLGCLLLLYLSSGAAFLHQHTSGPETTCHVCQVLHAPALTAARLNLIPQARQVARNSFATTHVAPTNSFAVHRTPRAPPSAPPTSPDPWFIFPALSA
jgi:hypothetical protein